MEVAIREAELSLREGNKGFGAVIVRNGAVFAGAHDSEVTESDPTVHAEMKLVRETCMKLGRSELNDCIVVSTHEPCPMCTGAMVWAKVSEIVYGTSITRSKSQGRTMIDLSSEEIVKRSPWQPKIMGGVLEARCSTLYDDATRNSSGSSGQEGATPGGKQERTFFRRGLRGLRMTQNRYSASFTGRKSKRPIS